jgi:hypothetical protein
LEKLKRFLNKYKDKFKFPRDIEDIIQKPPSYVGSLKGIRKGDIYKGIDNPHMREVIKELKAIQILFRIWQF